MAIIYRYGNLFLQIYISGCKRLWYHHNRTLGRLGSAASVTYWIQQIKHLIFEYNSKRDYGYEWYQIKCTYTTTVFQEVEHLEATVEALVSWGSFY